MKLVIFFLLAGSLPVSANVFSQMANIKFSMQEVALSDVIKKTRKQNEFTFFYSPEDINGIPLVLPLEPQQPQKKQLNGKVTNAIGEPVPGVSIIVKGTTIGTITDLDGNFSLDVPIDATTLVFSFIGYQPQELTIGSNTNFNVVLEEALSALDEVVIVGYGVQKKESSVAAISSARGDDLLKVGSVTSITDALQGLLTGVTSIASGTGKPGADAGEILIRGKASWQGNSPLVLVDGVERDMNDIDPNEVENISVLKDASATAVFGVKGGNGVILITTKRGIESKAQINFSSNFGFKQPTSSPEFADYVTAMQMYNEALANDKVWNSLIPEYKIAAWENAYATGNYGPYNEYFPQVNWADELLKDVGYQQQYNVNMRGGTKFIKYFASLGYLNDGDVYNSEPQEDFNPSYSYKRYNWRVNLDFNLTSSTVVSVNLAGKIGYRSQTGYRIDAAEGNNDMFENQFYTRLYTSSQNNNPIKWANGEWAEDFEGMGNPIMDFMTGGQRMYKYYEGFSDFKLNQKLDFITQGLSAKASFSFSNDSKYESYVRDAAYNTYKQNQISYYREYDYANPNPDGTYNLINEQRFPDPNYQPIALTTSYDSNTGYNRKIYYEMALNYGRSFGDHNVTALALFSRRESKPKRYNVQRRQEDWVGRLTYNYKERYLAEINGSYNGSEAFAPGLRFGAFYSGSIGWRLSEEPFIKDFASQWLNNFKLRYSYGTSGVDGSRRFLYQQSYETLYPAGDRNQWRYGVNLGGTSVVAYAPIYAEGDAANENATWETSIKQNLGLEFRFIDKISGTLDIYDERREGILMNVWAPMWYLPPGKTATGNIGETKNHGIELEIGWNDRIGNDLRYRVKGSMARNEGRIVYRQDGPGKAEHLRDAGKPIGWTSTRINTGYYTSLDDIYNYSTATSNTTQATLVPGDMMYVDYDANGVIDDKDKIVTKELDYPLNIYGLSLAASYKGWAMNMLFYGVTDVSKKMPDQILYDNIGGSRGILVANPNVTGRWTPENQANAVKPALHTNLYDNYSKKISSYSYRDASYVRLKNVEISYSFEKKNLKRFSLSKLQLYANGNNLITWTKLNKQLDPEATKLGVVPMVKRYNFGIRASF